jgi:hypothetical protein
MADFFDALFAILRLVAFVIESPRTALVVFLLLGAIGGVIAWESREAPASQSAAPSTATLTLLAPPGASDADLETCAREIERRVYISDAHVACEVQGGKVLLRVEEKQAASLVKDLLPGAIARGHAWIARALPSSEEELADEVARLADLHARGAYDPSKERHDLLEGSGARLLVERAGALDASAFAHTDAEYIDMKTGYVIDLRPTDAAASQVAALAEQGGASCVVLVVDDAIRARCALEKDPRGGYRLLRAPPGRDGFIAYDAYCYARYLRSKPLPCALRLDDAAEAPDAPTPSALPAK